MIHNLVQHLSTQLRVTKSTMLTLAALSTLLSACSATSGSDEKLPVASFIFQNGRRGKTRAMKIHSTDSIFDFDADEVNFFKQNNGIYRVEYELNPKKALEWTDGNGNAKAFKNLQADIKQAFMRVKSFTLDLNLQGRVFDTFNKAITEEDTLAERGSRENFRVRICRHKLSYKANEDNGNKAKITIRYKESEILAVDAPERHRPANKRKQVEYNLVNPNAAWYNVENSEYNNAYAVNLKNLEEKENKITKEYICDIDKLEDGAVPVPVNEACVQAQQDMNEAIAELCLAPEEETPKVVKRRYSMTDATKRAGSEMLQRRHSMRAGRRLIERLHASEMRR